VHEKWAVRQVKSQLERNSKNTRKSYPPRSQRGASNPLVSDLLVDFAFAAGSSRVPYRPAELNAHGERT
jgi:hypothetical protein